MNVAACELDPIVEAARRQIEHHVSALAPKAPVHFVGAYDLDPIHLAFWTIVETDEQKDGLKADETLIATFRRLLLDAGYPSHSVPYVRFAFESRETVDRDWAGSLWHAMK
jgi:hypothetical protein